MTRPQYNFPSSLPDTETQVGERAGMYIMQSICNLLVSNMGSMVSDCQFFFLFTVLKNISMPNMMRSSVRFRKVNRRYLKPETPAVTHKYIAVTANPQQTSLLSQENYFKYSR
jgi:hypothetical protein